uniref:Uncharacterized mitochondrial protein AtMg00810-like n=1 Tax=Tanacetum cinerariifolium TaxID=118510 RepID=A0A6L2N9Q1_TANCI|nr:uncharacterized mitochondrial protein AtMg00810-like [Tanacetum cinerariifolium]
MDTSTTNALVVQNGICGYDWSFQAKEGPTNFALMAYTSQRSLSPDSEVHTCSKKCLKLFESLQKQYDQQHKALNKSNIKIIGYQIGLESLEARIVVHEKNEAIYEESISFLKYNVQVKDISIKEVKNQLEKALKEKDDLKLKLDKFETSSKSLTKMQNSQISAKDKTGLGYNGQMNESKVLTNVVDSVSDSSECNGDDNQVNDRFKKSEEYHVVPHPYTGNYMPPRADLSFAGLDDSVFMSKVSETINSVPKIETITSKTSKDSLEKSKTVRSSAPLIEDYESDSEEENMLKSKEVKKIVKPSFEKIEFVNARNKIIENESKAEKPRKFSQSPRSNKRNWNGLMTQRLVLTKSKQVSVNTAKQSSHRSAASVSAARDVNTAAPRPKVNDALPKTYFYFKAHLPGNPQYALQDQGIFDSGCSRHMTGNKSYLTVYQEIDGGFVAFGENTKGGKITGKGIKPALSFMRSFGCPVTILNTLDHLGNQTNGNASTKENIDVGQDRKRTVPDQEYILLPLWTKDSQLSSTSKQTLDDGFKPSEDDEKKNAKSPGNDVPNNAVDENIVYECADDPNKPDLEDTSIFEDLHEDVFGAEADFNNMESTFQSAFIYGRIEEEIYVCQPPGFEDPDHLDKIYKNLVKDADGDDVDVHLYKSIIGSLMYLTASRPDIMYAVYVYARFQVTPKVSHLHVVKRIFRYLKIKPKLGLWYPKDSPFELVAYTDSDNAGASLDRKSTTGGCQFLGRRLISWQCKKQTVVATSTTEAEYVAAASCCGQVKTVNEDVWLQALVDGKKVIVNEASIRGALRLDDAEGTACLPNADIFEELARMGKHKSKRKQRKETEVSLDEPQTEEHVPTPSHDLLPSGDDIMQLSELMEIYTKLSDRVLSLEQDKTNQAVEIKKLKKRVKRLEGKKKKRTYRLKRLYKVGLSARVEPYEKTTSLGRMNEEEMFGVNDLIGDEVIIDATTSENVEQNVEKEVSTADPVTTAGEVVTTADIEVSTVEVTTTATISKFSKDELIQAQTLIEIKTAKPKAITTAATTTTAITRPKARGVIVQELSEFRTTPTPQPSKAKYKGKSIMVELEKPLKKKDQIAHDEEVTREL